MRVRVRVRLCVCEYWWVKIVRIHVCIACSKMCLRELGVAQDTPM